MKSFARVHLFWNRELAPAKTTAGEKNDPSRRKFGKTNKKISVDADLFARNPCRVPGGTSCHPCAYPAYNKGKESFGFLVQRLSDRNYAMRALCLDGYGAKYNTYKRAGFRETSVVWFPKTNLNDHANDEAIIDGCHLNLIDPYDGNTYLTGQNLESAIADAGEPVECVFLNGSESAHSDPDWGISADNIASAISESNDTISCISLTECKINANVIAAIASCSKLRGVILENCHFCGEGMSRPTDAKLAAVLRSCPDLRWCFIKSSIFGAECWNVLAMKDVCPDLEVLWIDAPVHTADRIDTAWGDHDTIRSALDGRADKLKLCMINPGDEVKSRYVIGGGKKTDRLNGRKRTAEETMMYLATGNPSSDQGVVDVLLAETSQVHARLYNYRAQV